MTDHSLNAFLKGAVPQVTVNKILQPDEILIDVRTADEFSSGCIPGALNHPLFYPSERSLIGTMYRQMGSKTAINQGKNIISPRLKHYLNDLKPQRSKLLTIYCARGGLRSGSVTRFLQSKGFEARQLIGGYKAYRNYVIEQLKLFEAPLIVLHGQTGVGKTLLIQDLPMSINLEELAQHRSSVFGAIDRKPRSQKNFEGLLHEKIRKFQMDQQLFIEGESRKVGTVFIPKSFAVAMKKGKKVLLKASMQTRIKRILSEYPVKDPETIQVVEMIIRTLKAQLGNNIVTHLCKCLNQGKMEEFVQILLKDYYDPKYCHGMRDYSYDLKLEAEDLNQARMKLLEFRGSQNSS